jgi:serine/threonine protein kinase
VPPAAGAIQTTAHSPQTQQRSAQPGRSGDSLHIGGYEVIKELGRGGMGVVYLARQVKLNRLVALKMILSGAHAGPAALARFRTEAETVARLQHPNIVQIFEVGEQSGLPYFSLEYCPGGGLSDKLRGTPLQPPQAAHVLLTDEGAPKITDFGLAKKLGEAGQTASGAIMGTASYMAPEQAGGKGAEVGPHTDVYALGAILYELLAGRPPFRAATFTDTLLQVLNEEPVPPTRLRPTTPRDLEAVCLKCLAKPPAERYAGARALAEDLARFLAGQPVVAAPLSEGEWMKRAARRAGYEILQELGRGGMGVVYKAEQLSLKRFVALKMILAPPRIPRPGAGDTSSTPLGRPLLEDEAPTSLLRFGALLGAYPGPDTRWHACIRMRRTNDANLRLKIVDPALVFKPRELADYLLVNEKEAAQVVEELQRLLFANLEPYFLSRPEALARSLGLEEGRVGELKRLLDREATRRQTAQRGADEQTRFRREAEVVARLRHPNIVQIHDFGELGGRSFIAMEMMEGGSLQQRLAAGGLAQREAAALTKTVAEAVEHAHQKGVVHRDLKPANILLTADGKPAITDFGLVHLLGGDDPLDAEGSVMGTPSYMAPEQAQGKPEATDRTTDVYALGAVLYELLTGRPPFRAATVMDTLREVISSEPVPPTDLSPKTSPALEAICLKCLRKDQKQRYASARELADDLDRFLKGKRPRAPVSSSWHRYNKWAKRYPVRARLLRTAFGLVLAVLLTVLGMILLRR